MGVGVLRARVRGARGGSGRGDAHPHGHDHHEHGHDHADRHHHVPSTITARGLVAMGASAGLIPCPSALVVLLGAVAQHQVGLGLGLIVAFSAGLAATLVALGLVVVLASGVTQRIGPAGRFATIASAISAAAIVAVGLVVTTQALPQL